MGNNYYPFGSKWHTSKTGSWHYDRLGAERETAFDWGIDMHPYRDYDPLTGRFRQVEPLAELYPSWSVYSAMGCNPTNYIDPLGLDWFRNTETGDTYWEDRTEANDGEEHLGAYHVIEGDNSYIVHYQNKVIGTVDRTEANASDCVNDCLFSDFSSRIPRASGQLNTMDGFDDPFFNVLTLGGFGMSSVNAAQDFSVLGVSAFKYGDDVWKTIIEPIGLTKQLAKAYGTKAVEIYEQIIKTQLSRSTIGKNIHNLGGSLKGWKAIDIPGTGKGRGGGRIIFREIDGMIEIKGLVKGHDYKNIID